MTDVDFFVSVAASRRRWCGVMGRSRLLATWRKIVRRKCVLLGGTLGLILTLVGLSVGTRLGLIQVSNLRSEGHWLWYVSRAAGVTSYIALVLATVWGLLLSTSVADAIVSRGRSLEAHRWLSSAALVLAVAHAVPLLGDRYVNFDVLDIVVPFLAPYRPVAVGLGIVGMYLTLAVYGSFWLRARLGNRAWRALHVLSFPAFGLLTLHGIFAGTDTGTSWMQTVYLGAIVLVGTLTIVRLLGRVSSVPGRASSRAEA
jgi:predicted ferric reductase